MLEEGEGSVTLAVQTETTETQKQKSNFLCMTATEPGVEDRVEDKHGNRYVPCMK